MRQQTERYECVGEPTATWMIWDNTDDAMAEIAGVALVGLFHGEAVAVCRMLNREEVGKPHVHITEARGLLSSH